ncbi:flagellar L-ring protein [Betaproteobacteria bacterium]|nr:flagellar L-ring protein [Betaproteobacteria bacterium]GHT95203.1 flagellar L-ring protein [Betaproteobacteria bacterium]GHU01405.1 flagellar L-ring protein [Betaproteobacteria bacterium]GHU10362.1 flagellar L-ring protein [Betaproteobacteria bacterium]GHU21928.1 flagellar L-ring protein [Betaproteobacteria bacterium]
MKAGSVLALWLALFVAGCASISPTPPTAVHQPMSARPVASAPVVVANGAIFQQDSNRPLFEDRRARRVGDVLTINLVERTSAQKSANSSASRSSALSGGIAGTTKLPLGALNGLSAEAGVDSEFTGAGAAAANNVFTGTITVTVVDVLANGNLLVSGEKMLAINQGNEYIRFSGVVNATTITGANTVQSTQVADARIEYRGSGFIDEHNTMGWLQRFFGAILPF